ncbi:hypothetical protein IQ22_01456 [Pseudomonas duriflava]|uniref:Uncharacterized protein n=1 Tax=Pseudomonas duriflava TaxID=459528 RepID=A0A562QFK0_9PSED|nr:hypothetical protein [Pseudomonas duriflava]TWI55532.1 hypothetical protein IQ22_01456 [Pseudomonas duriflava]
MKGLVLRANRSKRKLATALDDTAGVESEGLDIEKNCVISASESSKTHLLRACHFERFGEKSTLACQGYWPDLANIMAIPWSKRT